MSGEVFSQSSSRSKKKERIVKAEELPTEEINTTELISQGKARIDTKDGATYLGELVGESTESYTLKILSDDVITIEKKQVRRAKTPNNAIVLKQGRYHNTRGLYLHYSIGFNAGYNGGGFMSDAGLGYRLSKKLEIMTGIGFFGTNVNVLGLDNTWGSYKTFFPTYVGVKYNLTHNNTRIFATGKVGYSSAPFDFWNDNQITLSGGAYLEPAIGLSFASKRFGQTSISVSQMLQRSDLMVDSRDSFENPVSGSGNIWLKRVGVKLTTTLF